MQSLQIYDEVQELFAESREVPIPGCATMLVLIAVVEEVQEVQEMGQFVALVGREGERGGEGCGWSGGCIWAGHDLV